jgi:hypothetical protein
VLRLQQLGRHLLALEELLMDAHDDHLLVVRAIEDTDAAAFRKRLPLLFVAEARFDQRAGAAIRAIVRSDLVPAAELPRLRHALVNAAWWRDAWIVEAALFLTTVLLIVEGMRFDLPGALTTWRHAADGTRTPAGWWYGFFSLPWFQFLTWRWMARLLIWAQLLWRVFRLELQLIPTHPDRSGGFAPLAWPHESLAWFSFAMSAILVGTFAEEVMQDQRDVHDALMPLAVVVLSSTFVAVAPLLLFFPKLFESKHRGEHDYGILAATYTRAFDRKWVRGESGDDHLLGSPDIQSLADMASSFDVVHGMRVVRFSRGQLLQLAAAALAPAAPLVLFVIPLNELLIRGAQLLFPL